LTRCCEEDILTFEAYSSLHPLTDEKDDMFVDIWHPSIAGHTQLAIDLSAFIMTTILDE
jgi:phospholipase/lecithinase/hemolysin